MTAENIPIPVRAVVPMIRVVDIDRSVAFYRLLGFDIGNFVPPEGPMSWVWLYARHAANWKLGPNLMLTRSDCAIDVEAQRVLFYLYARDLVALREKLLAAGIAAGEISYPEYLPEGEFCAADPDGYTLMIAQAGQDTP